MTRSSFRTSMAALGVASLLAATALARPAAADPLSGAREDNGSAADPLSASAEDLTGEIAVDFDDAISADEFASIEQRYGLSPNSAYGAYHDHIELAAVPSDREDAVLEALSHEPGVAHAERMDVLSRVVRPRRPAVQGSVAHDARRRASPPGSTAAAAASRSRSSTPASRASTGPFSRGSDLAGTRCGGVTTSSTTRRTRSTTRGTARTSPGPSRRRRTTASGRRAWRSARRSCRSRC